MADVLNYNASARQSTPLASNLTDYYTKKLKNGGVDDAMRAKFTEMDDATGATANQTRTNAIAPTMFGQGAASRAGQNADNSIMQQVAQSKLKQIQETGTAATSAAAGAQSWQGQQDTQSNTDRDFSYKAASDLGDSVTMAGMGKSSLGQQGYDYTDYGKEQLISQASQQKEDADWARTQQREQWELSKKQQQAQIDESNKSWYEKLGDTAISAAGAAATGGLSTAAGMLAKKYLGSK